MAGAEPLRISEAEMESYSLLCEACLLLQSTVKNDLTSEILNSICAKNISEHLKKRFAFLPGGRGKDDAMIITFPEYPSFSEISEEVVQKVLSYLTAIPRWTQEILWYYLKKSEGRSRHCPGQYSSQKPVSQHKR